RARRRGRARRAARADRRAPRRVARGRGDLTADPEPRSCDAKHDGGAAPMKTTELFDLSGRVAIVTGGGTGIGRQMAEALAEMGADLVLCSRHLDRVQRTAGDLRKLGVRAIGLRCDLRDGREIETVVERTISELGRIDVLVNNSGTAWGAPAEEMPLDGWQKVVDVNL